MVPLHRQTYLYEHWQRQLSGLGTNAFAAATGEGKLHSCQRLGSLGPAFALIVDLASYVPRNCRVRNLPNCRYVIR